MTRDPRRESDPRATRDGRRSAFAGAVSLDATVYASRRSIEPAQLRRPRRVDLRGRSYVSRCVQAAAFRRRLHGRRALERDGEGIRRALRQRACSLPSQSHRAPRYHRREHPCVASSFGVRRRRGRASRCREANGQALEQRRAEARANVLRTIPVVPVALHFATEARYPWTM